MSSITAEWLDMILQSYFRNNGPQTSPFQRKVVEGTDTEITATTVEDEEEEESAAAGAVSVHVLDFQVRPGCEEGENLLSDLLAIDVTFKRDGRVEEQVLHLMAKLLSQDPFCRHFIIEAGFDVREIHFYTTLIPALTHFCNDGDGKDGAQISSSSNNNWPIPLCYYAKYRPGTDSILVLDNLKESGYAMVDFAAGLSLDETCAAVRSVAHVHAAALAYRLRQGIDLIEAFPFLFQPEAAAESYQQLLERGLPQLASFLHTADDPQLHAVLAKLHKLRPRAKQVITDLLRPSSAIATLSHTDFWCNNLLFRRVTIDGNGDDDADASRTTTVQCSIVDWQMVTFGRPTNDIALLLVTSVAGNVRRSQTQHVLDVYWQTLTKHCARLGVDVEAQLQYTRDDLQREYQESLLLAVLLGIGSVDLAIGREATEQRLCQVLLDLSNDQVF